MKHRPELQWAYGKFAETDQVRWKAIEVEPLLTPRAPTEPNARATARKGLTPPAKTWRKRGDIVNVIDQRDRRKEKEDGTPRTWP